MNHRVLVFKVLFLIPFYVFGAHNINITPQRLNKEEIKYLKKDLSLKSKSYDKKKKMLFWITPEKHYHSDLEKGVRVHRTRESMEYAVALLRTKDRKLIARGLDIIKTVLPMQEKDTTLSFCGIWPYYPEDPLKGRKAPVDYNWADFMAVPLIDVIINHSELLSDSLKAQIKDALILSAYAIKKRDVQPDYTNICIMGTYVCYVVGYLYDIHEIENYARNRLKKFYLYTLKNKGFTEYNSPTYTIVALDELLRLKLVVANPEDKKMIDKLYSMTWSMIARHFHAPSGQWCGPNFRSYSSLTSKDFYRLLYNASNGLINIPGDYLRIPNEINPHKIPADILPLFLNQKLPKLEIDTFVVADKNILNYSKDIIGKLYKSPQFALASVNHSYMWNQTRPVIAHWGTSLNPTYLQLRFLHDFYDFSSANITSSQDTNTVVSIFNFATNGGDTHPSIDLIKDSTIEAKDLRIRFEVGGDLKKTSFKYINDSTGEYYILRSKSLISNIKIPFIDFDSLTGYWAESKEKGKIYLDYVLYSGKKKSFNLSTMNKAMAGVVISFSPAIENLKARTTISGNYVSLSCDGLSVTVPYKPTKLQQLFNNFKIENNEIKKTDDILFVN